MSKKSYTADDIRKLMEAKPFLKKTEAEKFAKYKSADPFPWIGAALLNSADLLKYLLTVGIVEPFEEKKLKGVTYQCAFSGEAYRFESESNSMKEIPLGKDNELILEPNSIIYLKIEEKLRVPEYMALRFNLSVSNAYKGLLLGTGPIVDPGFEGNLFIPLHNLTGNEYIIKKGAPLIRIEFTKLSRHAAWDSKKGNLFPPVEPITKETPKDASFYSFIEDALLDSGKKQFFTRGGVISVRSSIPDAIANSAKKADDAQKSASEAEKSAKNAQETMRNWSIISAISAAIAVVGILLTSYSLIQDANARYDGMVQAVETCKQQICMLTQQLEEAQERLDLYEMAQSSALEQELDTVISSEINLLTPSPSGEVDEGE